VSDTIPREVFHRSPASFFVMRYVYLLHSIPHPEQRYVCGNDDFRAIEFETYLKSGSGAAFARRHLC
jgi:hypothetical protein